MSLDKLTVDAFNEHIQIRKDRMEAASGAALPEILPVNALAKKLHPARQFMKISEIEELEKGTKRFRLVPNPAKGTTECAPLRAGQYLVLHLNINGMKIDRPYTASSSPKASREGYYEVTIKYVEDGLVSRYALDNWKVGDEIEVGDPRGNFTYSRLRDAKTVVALAGGSGITPFVSFAQAIADGDEDFNLTLIYGSRKEENILYHGLFDEIQKKTSKVKVVHVLSDEEKPGYEHGFISADLIKKYAPAGDYSIFVCGPEAMYRFVGKEIDKLGLAKKFVRFELAGEVHNPAQLEGYPGCKQDTVKITVSVRDEQKTVTGNANDSILQTLEKNGIAVPTSCRGGECGWCHSLLKSGQVYVPKAVDGRRAADFKYGGIHPCVTFPLSDIEIIVPYAK